MALIEPRDFSESFENNYRNDIEHISRTVSDIVTGVGREVGGVFEELSRSFETHRPKFLELFDKFFDDQVYRQRVRIDDAIPAATYAVMVVFADKVLDNQRNGNKNSDDFIDRERRDNPILRGIDGGGRDSRDIARQSYDSRDNNRSQSGRYPTQTRPRANVSDRHTRTGVVSNDRPRYQGSMQTQVVEEQPMRQVQQVVEQTPLVADESIITSNNVSDVSHKGLNPCYIIGKEQVIIKEGKLLVVPYNGRNAVDYEQHRIDRYYASVLPASNAHTDLTRIALNSVKQAKDNAIIAFVANEEGKEATAINKLFDTISSGMYKQVLDTKSATFDPIDVRNTMLEMHGGSFEWFTDNALAVTVTQRLELRGVSNDVLIRIKTLLESAESYEVVKLLVLLVQHIDPAVWRTLHDYITVNFNLKMASINLEQYLDSITADWSDLVALLTESAYIGLPMLAKSEGMTEGMTLCLDDEIKTIDILREVMYIPISSFDFDLGIVGDQPIYQVPKGSIMYDMCSNLSHDGSRLYVTTLDGVSFELFTYSTLGGDEFILRKI